MKRLILCLAMISMTFGLGIGVHSLVSGANAPPPQIEASSLLSVQPQIELIRPVGPIAPVPTATPEPLLILDYDPEKFTPWAVFYIMGRLPKEFADLDSLEVGLNRDVDDHPGYISVNTCDPSVNCNGALATFALVTEQRLFFATSQMRNSEFEYRFDGKFLRTDFNAVEGKNIAVLRGTLTKTKHGRKNRRTHVQFSHGAPGMLSSEAEKNAHAI